MRSSIRSAFLLLAALSAACDGDGATGPRLDDTDASRIESFGPLSAAALAQSNGPFPSTVASAPMTADGARAAVLALLPTATITSVEADDERSLAVWEVDAMLPSGALLEFKLLQATGHVVDVEGERGPFDYTLAPGNGIVAFETARDASLAARSGRVVQWELDLEDDDRGDDRWEYEFYIHDDATGLWEVELDAKTGRVLEVKPKRGSGRGSRPNAGDDDRWTDRHVPDSIRQRALGLVRDLTLVEVDAERDNDVFVWEFEFRSASGREVELKLVAATGALFEVEGDDDATDYDIVPGDGLLSLREARERALAAQAGRVEEWELERNRANAWEYEFYIERDGRDWTVKVNALTGDVRTSRDDGDDDDDDDDDDQDD